MNRTTHPSSLVVLTFVLIAGAWPSAATWRQVDIPERLRGAERAVVAKVISVEARYETNSFGDELIVSRAHVKVEEVLKGEPGQEDLDVDVEGGTIGDLTLRVSDLPQLRSGERAVFLLRRGPDGVQLPHLRGLGILKLDDGDVVEASSLTLETIRGFARRGGAY